MSCRHNFLPQIEKLLNDQYNKELSASMYYLHMSFFLKREKVAYHNVANLFMNMANEEMAHAKQIADYIVERGGTVITSVTCNHSLMSSDLQDAFNNALRMELDINQSLLNLCKSSDTFEDTHVTAFIEDNFLGEQIKSQKELSDYLTTLSRCDRPYDYVLFDQSLKN